MADEHLGSGESAPETSYSKAGPMGIAPTKDAAPSMVFVMDLAGRIVQRTPYIALSTSDGRRRPIQWSANTLTAADGNVTGTIFVGTDISEQKRAQREVFEERDLNRAILALSLDGIIMTNEEGIVASWNKSAEEMFGYAPSDIVGRHFSLVIPSLDLANPAALGMESLLGVARELEGRRADGTLFPCRLSLATIKLGGAAGFCAFIRNLTESRKVEEQLRQSMKMEAVGRLASGIAHDFNNLLMGVSGCASVALECADAGRSNRVYLTEIKKAAASGTAMTKQLLAFGRKSDLQSVVFDLDARIYAQQALLRRLLGEDIELSVKLESSNAPIRADLGQIDQVLMNLAANARDAMPHGGRLSIETQVVFRTSDTNESSPDTRYVALRVRDSGCGMSAATRDRIFDPFYTTKDAGKGTGLGLATVNDIVKEWGGRIHLHSAEGAGTLFEILLPLSVDELTPLPPDEPSTLKMPTARHGIPTSSRTILLCEDDRLVRLTLRYYLEAAGYSVLKADCGADAIETCRLSVKPIDLLLTDVVLPDQSGERIASEISKLRPDIKVLYMSAHSLEWLQSEGRVDCAIETLQKPFDRVFLLDRIARIFDQKASSAHEPAACLGSVLVVEDCHAARLAIIQGLKDEGWSVVGAADGSEARTLVGIREEGFDVLLVDYSLPDTTGNVLAAEFHAAMPNMVIAYMSGYPGLVLDPPGPLLVKPIELEELYATIRSLMGIAAAEVL